VSQTEVEQRHIIDAFVFELSKCETELRYWPRAMAREKGLAGARA
jgi:hypothetical protein